MPLTRGRDTKSAYYRWEPADHGGSKYHYTAGDKTSRARAKALAMTQAKAIKTSKHNGGAAKRKPKKRMVSSAARAKQKIVDKGRIAETAAYRRTAAKRS